MATHIRFDGKTGRVEPRTTHGQYTAELLQLNDDATVQYRLNALKIVQLFSREIDELERQLKAIAGQLLSGKISQAKYDEEVQSINQDLVELRQTMQAQTGELPLLPLRKTLRGVSLLMGS